MDYWKKLRIVVSTVLGIVLVASLVVAAMSGSPEPRDAPTSSNNSSVQPAQQLAPSGNKQFNF